MRTRPASLNKNTTWIEDGADSKGRTALKTGLERSLRSIQEPDKAVPIGKSRGGDFGMSREKTKLRRESDPPEQHKQGPNNPDDAKARKKKRESS